MKQVLLLLNLCLCFQNMSASINTVEEDITVTFPDDFTNGWDQYIGQTVVFNEKETGECFVFSINHFKAQNTDPTTGEETTGVVRLSNAQNLTRFLANQQSSNYYNDPDILIMGDLNSYAKDYPIMHIADAGYINELTKHDPGTYSHIFDNEAGCLDHVFASESMDKQITGATVYHINCDEYYRYAYKYYDFSNSMYIYSDHDPIIVGSEAESGIKRK